MYQHFSSVEGKKIAPSILLTELINVCKKEYDICIPIIKYPKASDPALFKDNKSFSMINYLSALYSKTPLSIKKDRLFKDPYQYISKIKYPYIIDHKHMKRWISNPIKHFFSIHNTEK